LLRVAEELGIRKEVRTEFGGGIKEFIFEDQDFFEGADDASTFLSSQERQSIVRHMVFNLRAHEGDQLGAIRFLEGQAIGVYYIYIYIAILLFNENRQTH